MGKTRNTGKLATQIQFDNSNNLVIGNSTSSSFNTSGSVNAIGGITGSIFGIGNPTSFSASISSNLVNLESKSASVDTTISSINSKTGSYATTGSNSFFGTQTFSGSVFIANDLVVQGSSSIQYISASSVSIGTNIVQLNTANPSVRYAGLTIIDSGSVGGSGSFLYDSLQDEFIFVHRGNGTNITSSHFVLGPETFDNLGNETYLTCNIITKGTGKEHLVDSCIFDNGTTTCIKNNLVGTGTMSGTTIYGSTAVCSPVGKFTTCLDLGGALTGTSATFSGTLTDKATNISADGAGVVLQGYVDNNLRIAVRGSGYNDGARGGLLASTGDFGSTLSVTGAATFSSTITGTSISGTSIQVTGQIARIDTIYLGGGLNGTGNTAASCYQIESAYALASCRTSVSRGIQYGGTSYYILLSAAQDVYVYYKLALIQSSYFCGYARFTNAQDGTNRTGISQYSFDNGGTWSTLGSATFGAGSGTAGGGVATSSGNYSGVVVFRAALTNGSGNGSLIGIDQLHFMSCGYGMHFINTLG